MRAERIWLDTDEDGFHLMIEDDQGKIHDFNVQSATNELQHAARQIQDWESEGYARPRK